MLSPVIWPSNDLDLTLTWYSLLFVIPHSLVTASVINIPYFMFSCSRAMFILVFLYTEYLLKYLLFLSIICNMYCCYGLCIISGLRVFSLLRLLNILQLYFIVAIRCVCTQAIIVYCTNAVISGFILLVIFWTLFLANSVLLSLYE